ASAFTVCGTVQFYNRAAIDFGHVTTCRLCGHAGAPSALHSRPELREQPDVFGPEYGRGSGNLWTFWRGCPVLLHVAAGPDHPYALHTRARGEWAEYSLPLCKPERSVGMHDDK